MKNTSKFPLYTAIVGCGLWMWWIIAKLPSPKMDEWAEAILLLAALCWLPISDFVQQTHSPVQLPVYLRYVYGLAAFCLFISFWMPQGIGAGIWSLPWLIVTFIIGGNGLWILWRKWEGISMGIVCLVAAQIFLPVGGAWTFASRIGWQPMGFSPAIVLLTGIHFHYAGFLFPLLCGLLAIAIPSKRINWACIGAIISIPMTAIGITVTQYFQTHLVEILSATTVAISGILCASVYFQQGWKQILNRQLNGLAWMSMAVCLLLSMTLAFAYSIRTIYPLDLLTIPNMRAWHGSLNSIGVVGLGLWGWLGQRKNDLSLSSS